MAAVLVLRGNAGIGKTALMRYCSRQAERVTQLLIDFFSPALGR